MKKLMLVCALIALLVLAGCDNRSALDKKWEKITSQSDPEAVSELTDKIRQGQAEMEGDTYCGSCKKYIEGIVRICPHCGQYINK